jgi:hypothetical protein
MHVDYSQDCDRDIEKDKNKSFLITYIKYHYINFIYW